MLVQTAVTPTSICATRHLTRCYQGTPLITQHSISVRYLSRNVLLCKNKNHVRPLCCLSNATGSYIAPDPELKSNIDSKSHVGNEQSSKDKNGSTEDKDFPKTIPRKPRRGRKSEAVAVEDFIRNSLEQTFASIREKSSEVPENLEHVMKGRTDVDSDSEVNDREDKSVVIVDESKNWPLDADVGWGTRASEYFDQHPIRNTVGEDGVEIDWEGEMDKGWVKEINCLEWEDFAFHPSPLIVLIFERYNRSAAEIVSGKVFDLTVTPSDYIFYLHDRASDNWKVLTELEKAAKVYWDNENCLPPRTVKIDINIERDLAYALKVKEGPELLFLRGNRIIYREKNIRTSAELVLMIAHFYYKAKKPAWI